MPEKILIKKPHVVLIVYNVRFNQDLKKNEVFLGLFKY